MKMNQDLPRLSDRTYSSVDWVIRAFMPHQEHDVEIRKMLTEMEAYIEGNYKGASLYPVMYFYIVKSDKHWFSPNTCKLVLKDLAENKPEWFEQLQILKFEKDLLG